MKAIQDMTLFEVSTSEFEDLVMVEDDYGRVYLYSGENTCTLKTGVSQQRNKRTK